MSAPCPPHHWRVETPNGPTVRGMCRGCGKTRLFESALGWKRGLPVIPGRGFGRKVSA